MSWESSAIYYQIINRKVQEIVKLPATTRFAMPSGSWTRKILEVKNNAAIEDANFSASIK